ncbi:MAG: hypothetical protein RIR00_2274 [Pseudomonadota bacterium]
MSLSLAHIVAESGVNFGTSGARGLVSQLSDAVCYAYTQAFLTAVAPAAREVVIGHDLRPSSPAMAAACAQALRDGGRSVRFVGALPTPAIAHYALSSGCPAIIITGSHIPFDRNGIKFYRADGEISKDDEQAMLASPVSPPAGLTPAPLPTADPAAATAYVRRYTDFFPAGMLQGRCIAVYEHSSVARDLLRQILEALGATVLPLGRTDTFVPIDTEAVRPEDIAQAEHWASQHRFDALLSTDGDADRPLIGDEAGQWLRGDIVGILCAQALRADLVVTPVSSNTAVERCGAFRQVLRTRIGSPYVIAGMEALRRATPDAAIAGYEANGGFLLGSAVQRGAARLTPLPTRDAVLPMLALLALAVEKGCPVSQLATALPPRYTASDRLQQFAVEKSRALLASLAADPAAAAALLAPDAGAVSAWDQTDGLRLSFADGAIVHLRPSGNAPELRCYAEADTASRAAALCAAALERVSRSA